MYYVNYGRWSDFVVGPFDDLEVARSYVSRCFTTSNPKVVTVREPAPLKLEAAEEACKRTFHVTFCGGGVAAPEGKLVIVATSQAQAQSKAIKLLDSLGVCGGITNVREA